MIHLLRCLTLFSLCAFATGCATFGSRAPRTDPDEMARLRERVAIEPANSHWTFRLGETHEARDELPEAEGALRSALALDPAHEPSLSLLSKILYRTKRHEEAVALLEGHRARGPLREELVVALALHYEAIDRLDEASDLVAALESDLERWESAGSAVAYLRLRGEDYSSSLEITKRALDAEASAVNHNNHGIALLYSGDPSAAKKSFLTAKKLDGNLPGPLYNLAIVDWFYFFDREGAREWFQQYQRLSQEDPDGLAEILAAAAPGGSSKSNEETE